VQQPLEHVELVRRQLAVGVDEVIEGCVQRANPGVRAPDQRQLLLQPSRREG
jgi:hypothetical protein